MYGIFDHRLDTSQDIVPLPEKEKAIKALDKSWVKASHPYIQEYPRVKRHYLEAFLLHKQMQEVISHLDSFENNDFNRLILFKVAKDHVQNNIAEECHVICLTEQSYKGEDMRFILQYHIAQTSSFILSFSKEV